MPGGDGPQVADRTPDADRTEAPTVSALLESVMQQGASDTGGNGSQTEATETNRSETVEPVRIVSNEDIPGQARDGGEADGFQIVFDGGGEGADNGREAEPEARERPQSVEVFENPWNDDVRENADRIRIHESRIQEAELELKRMREGEIPRNDERVRELKTLIRDELQAGMTTAESVTPDPRDGAANRDLDVKISDNILESRRLRQELGLENVPATGIKDALARLESLNPSQEDQARIDRLKLVMQRGDDLELLRHGRAYMKLQSATMKGQGFANPELGLNDPATMDDLLSGYTDLGHAKQIDRTVKDFIAAQGYEAEIFLSGMKPYIDSTDQLLMNAMADAFGTNHTAQRVEHLTTIGRTEERWKGLVERQDGETDAQYEQRWRQKAQEDKQNAREMLRNLERAIEIAGGGQRGDLGEKIDVDGLTEAYALRLAAEHAQKLNRDFLRSERNKPHNLEQSADGYSTARHIDAVLHVAGVAQLEYALYLNDHGAAGSVEALRHLQDVKEYSPHLIYQTEVTEVDGREQVVLKKNENGEIVYQDVVGEGRTFGELDFNISQGVTSINPGEWERFKLRYEQAAGEGGAVDSNGQKINPLDEIRRMNRVLDEMERDNNRSKPQVEAEIRQLEQERRALQSEALTEEVRREQTRSLDSRIKALQDIQTMRDETIRLKRNMTRIMEAGVRFGQEDYDEADDLLDLVKADAPDLYNNEDLNLKELHKQSSSWWARNWKKVALGATAVIAIGGAVFTAGSSLSLIPAAAVALGIGAAGGALSHATFEYIGTGDVTAGNVTSGAFTGALISGTTLLASPAMAGKLSLATSGTAGTLRGTQLVNSVVANSMTRNPGTWMWGGSTALSGDQIYANLSNTDAPIHDRLLGAGMSVVYNRFALGAGRWVNPVNGRLPGVFASGSRLSTGVRAGAALEVYDAAGDAVMHGFENYATPYLYEGVRAVGNAGINLYERVSDNEVGEIPAYQRSGPRRSFMDESLGYGREALHGPGWTRQIAWSALRENGFLPDSWTRLDLNDQGDLLRFQDNMDISGTADKLRRLANPWLVPNSRPEAPRSRVVFAPEMSDKPFVVHTFLDGRQLIQSMDLDVSFNKPDPLSANGLTQGQEILPPHLRFRIDQGR